MLCLPRILRRKNNDEIGVDDISDYEDDDDDDGVGDDVDERNDDACQSHRLTRKSGMPVTPRRKCSWLYKSSL